MDAETLINLVQDVKSLVDRYGVDTVKDTLDYVAKMRMNKDTATRSLYSKAGAHTVVSSVLFSQIRDTARAGRKIEAIKLLRTYTNIGLKEAKEIVEDNFM